MACQMTRTHLPYENTASKKKEACCWAQVAPNVSVEDLDELSSLLQVPLVAGTVNRAVMWSERAWWPMTGQLSAGLTPQLQS